MIGSLPLSAAALVALASFLPLPHVSANWDHPTGHGRDRAPSPSWLAKNHPIVVTEDIQVAECAMNTRTHWPYAQLFAWHYVNHSQDHYHGCSYGRCMAFTTFPSMNETVPDFTNSNIFWWHKLGGVPGIGVHAIANPQTGEFGYETSLKGKYEDGPAPAGEEQTLHDLNWPGWKKEANTIHPDVEDSKTLAHKEADVATSQPIHPKCGRPCEPNKDPGQLPGKYGNYKPAPASAYLPPPDWTPTEDDKCCTKSGNNPAVCQPPSEPFKPTPGPKYPPSKPKTHSCVPLCNCLTGCNQGDDNCLKKCAEKHKSCKAEACQKNRYPGLAMKTSNKKHQKRRH